MLTFKEVYDNLYCYYGPQGWWPADTPIEMIVGSILVQHTNWRNAEKALQNIKDVLTAEALDNMPLEELAYRIRPSGFYNIKAKRIKTFLDWFKKYQFQIEKIRHFDRDKLRKELLSIQGVGHETADVILLYVFDKSIFIADAYARRIFHRFGYNIPKGYDAFRIDVEEALSSSDVDLYNEYHALLVEHGKVHCKSDPICTGCPLSTYCRRLIHS
ncbi:MULTISPECIES: endonuclease III domain-containing protein [Virgibacillus]|uniref:3-methyladenine DNA glycosylase n=2 Tax=Virgibacillus TaxID=84406 RepID=A0A024Q6M6_9BACI|nr:MULTISPECIES: endonuclease III domain-containing protein [Virgibacillus]EQB38362.1 hypothetical protein M948_07215 [Virgibacillus sp. CM-4]MYL41069.1 endonuclease [Virgibacillus massiliensis]GGJ54009.1 endonuclease III [Virgibacillus kapii]CDQ38129.1 3-methyladenine DNA glycosylase [Virgibacillus massiliensis]